MTTTKDKGVPVEVAIPKEGALGILALGAVGLRAWREVRDGKDGVAGKKEERGNK